jgi:hypothetical protein
MEPRNPALSPACVTHVQMLLDSFKHLTGAELLERGSSKEEQALRVFECPFIVVSHGTEADPIFNYANAAAQNAFELDWAAFTQMPSRLSAEAVERGERERLMAEVRRSGCIRNYRGIRISRSGRRFQIDDATVWNFHDRAGALRGQAAALFQWHFL